MSSAVVAAPVYIPIAASLAPLLVPMAAAAAVGVIIAALVDAQQQQAAALEREPCLAQIRVELDRAAAAIEQRLVRARVVPGDHRALNGALDEVRRRSAVLLDEAATDAGAARGRLAAVRAAMEAVQQQLVVAEQRCLDAERRRLVLLPRARALRDELARQPVDAAVAAAIGKLDAALAFPTEQVDEQVERLAGAIAESDAWLGRASLEALARQATAGADAAELDRYRRDIADDAEALTSEKPAAVSAALQQLIAEAETATARPRLRAIRDELRLVRQSVAQERALHAFFRERLEAALTVLPPEVPLTVRIREVLATDSVPRVVHDELAQAVEAELARALEQRRHAYLAEKLRENLQRLDYIVLAPTVESTLAAALRGGRPALLDTRYDDLKVVVRLGEGESLSLRLVHVVASAADKVTLTEHQRQQDCERMQVWCRHLDGLLEELRAAGILLRQTVRIEHQVDCLTIEQLEQQQIDVASLCQTLGRRNTETGAAGRSGQRRQDG